jgi:hypothetical protein
MSRGSGAQKERAPPQLLSRRNVQMVATVNAVSYERAVTEFRRAADNFEVMFHSTQDIQEEGTVPTRMTRVFILRPNERCTACGGVLTALKTVFRCSDIIGIVIINARSAV